MEFIHKNKVLYSTLSSKDFINHVYECNFLKKSINLSKSPEWMLHLELISPLYFFQDSGAQLRSLLVEINQGTFPKSLTWNVLKDDLNIQYINALVYYFLLEPNEVPRVQLIAVNAASYYFLLLSLPDSITNNVYQKNVFNLAMKTLQCHMPANNPNEIHFIKDFYYLMQHNYEVLSLDIKSVIRFLSVCTRYKCLVEFQQFEHPGDNISHYAFCGLKLFLKDLHEHGRKFIKEALCWLARNFDGTKEGLNYQSDEAVKCLHSNTSLFICKLPKLLPPVLAEYCDVHVITFAKLLCVRQTTEKRALQIFIKTLPLEIYLNFREWLLNTLTHGENERRLTLIDIIPLLFLKNDELSKDKATVFNSVIMNQVMQLCCESQETMSNKGFKILEEALSSNDCYKKAAVQQYFSSSNTDREMIFYAISKSMDSYGNIRNLKSKLLCLVHILDVNVDWFNAKTINWIHVMCTKSPSNDLRNVIPFLKDIVYKYPDSQLVMKLFFNVCVPYIVSPAPYSKAISTIVCNVIYDTSNAERLSALAEILISTNYDVVNVFRKLNDFGLIHPNMIRNVLDMNLNASLWKLVAVSISYTNFTSLLSVPEKLQQMLYEDNEIPHIKLIIFTLYQMIDKNPALVKHPLHSGMLHDMQYLLFNAITENRIAYEAIPAAIRFKVALNRAFGQPTTWAISLLRQKEDHLFHKILDLMSGAVEDTDAVELVIRKDTACVVELLTITRLHLKPQNMQNLVSFVDFSRLSFCAVFFATHRDIWSEVMLLYGRICLRTPSRIDEAVPIFQELLNSPFEEIKIIALDILTDICTHHLHHFDAVIPTLFNFLVHPSNALRYKSIKLIMNLVDKDQLKFNDIQYCQVVSLLVDSNYTVRNQTENGFKNICIRKYENYVAGQFVQTIVHLNYYERHPTLRLVKEELDILRKYNLKSVDRCKIYLFVFESLNENLQLNIVDAIGREIITPIINRSMPSDSPALDVLYDALTVVSMMGNASLIPKDAKKKKLFYTKFLKSLLASFINNYKKFTKEQKQLFGHVRSILTNLMHLLFKIDQICPTIMENIFNTVILLTNKFRNEVVDMIQDGETSFADEYRKLNKFFQDRIDTFDYERGEWHVELNFDHYMEEEHGKQEVSMRDFGGTFEDIMPY